MKVMKTNVSLAVSAWLPALGTFFLPHVIATCPRR
jgi:hypothetical protein